MERSFCQDCFASKKRFGNTAGDVHGPSMVLIVRADESNDETGIGDTFHGREKPLREDTFLGPPEIAPAWRIKR